MFWRCLLPAVAAAILCSVAAAETAVDKLTALAAAAPDGVIRLNDDLFDLITNPKREYSVAVQLTALGANMKCTPCREFDPAFRAVSKAWSTVPKAERDKHFFASADFNDAQGTFKKLNLMTAPVVTFYPATQGPNKLASGKTESFNYDFTNFGNEAKELAVQFSQFTPVPIPYKAPFDWGLLLSLATATLLLLLTVRLVLPVIMNRWVWALITIGTMLIMISGFMFVRIRGMPFRTRDHSMLPQFQNQVGAEIYTVSFKYFTLSAAFLGLILAAPAQQKKNAQRSAIYILTGIIMFMFSALVKDFKVKNGGYPFSYIF